MTVFTPEYFNERDSSHLPGHLGLKVTQVAKGRLEAEIKVRKELLAINDFLHAGTVITLCDTSAGYGCMANLPEGASGFTTIELKCNLMGTAREGKIKCTSTCIHSGRTTQIWESEVFKGSNNKAIAKFTCTQLIIYTKS